MNGFVVHGHICSRARSRQRPSLNFVWSLYWARAPLCHRERARSAIRQTRGAGNAETVQAVDNRAEVR